MIDVLIVDDHASFRAAACRLLEHAGFRVVGEAFDGKSAIDAVSRFAPDLILLDLQLPGDDGFAISEHIMSAYRGSADRGPAIVLTSGRPIAHYRRRLAASRAVGFIPKAELTGAALRTLVAHETAQ